MEQQNMTAVEWLVYELERCGYFEINDRFPITFEQAIKMEQEQLKQMYLKGIENYDPTFKRKSQWTEVDNKTRRLK